MVPNEVKANYSREIVIDNHVFIGANALILPGAHLKYGCVVQAGSIISGTVSELEIVSKNGKLLKKRQPPNKEFEIKID
jgi:acetyltransferase-like isoleucine patch superfamily enzyme